MSDSDTDLNAAIKKTVDKETQRISNIVLIIYAIALIACAIGWAVYYKLYGNKVSTIKGKIWRRQETNQDPNYYKIVPGSTQRQPEPARVNMYSQPEYLMPGLISNANPTPASTASTGTSVFAADVSQMQGPSLPQASLDRPPSYEYTTAVYPQIEKY